MEINSNIKQQIARSRTPIIVGVLYLVAAWIFSLPPHESYFVNLGRIQAILQLLLGFIGLIFASPPLSLQKPSFAEYVLLLPFVIALVFGLKVLLRRLTGSKRRNFIIVFILGHFLCGFWGLLFTLFSGLIITPDLVCEFPISSRSAIRVSSYLRQIPSAAGDDIPKYTFFLSVSFDDKETWDQFFYFSHTTNLGCGGMELLNSNFFGVWVGNHVIVTHDGGQTWYITNICNLTECRSLSAISELELADQNNGNLILSTSSNQNESHRFYTHDGGLTWHEANE